MKLGRILFPVKNLGPGNRVGIWMKGCNRGCKGCANPELWDNTKDGDISVSVIQDVIQQLKDGDYPKIEGVTISGGEPFEQSEALRELMNVLKEEELEDILVFTGYQLTELQDKHCDILDDVAVLVDGPYIEDENECHPLKGSKNQRIHYLKEEYRKKYEKYIQEENGKKKVQMFPIVDGKIATGIHEKDFNKEFQRRIQDKV